MASRPPPPPSFSSFPDLPASTATASAQIKKSPPPPPSFTSFPSIPSVQASSSSSATPSSSSLLSPASRPTSTGTKRAAKRTANDFLDQVRSELSESVTSSRRDNFPVLSSQSKGKGKELSREYEREDKLAKDAGRGSGTKRMASGSERRTFTIDSKGDDFNLQYGGLYKGDIPRHRRVGAGRVIGLNAGLRITLESAYTGRGLEVAARSNYHTPRYSDPRSARHATDRHYKRISLSRSTPFVLGAKAIQDKEHADPFLPTSTDPSRFVAFIPEDPVPVLEFEDGQDYRSIAGLAKASDLDALSALDQDDDAPFEMGVEGGESLDDYLKRRNIELDRALRQHPNDIEAWMAFVDFQDEISLSAFGGGSSSMGRKSLSRSERTSTCEIKLSILDGALGMEGNQRSEKLLLAYLKAMSGVDTPQNVLAKWITTLEKFPELTGLWIEYVSWRQTSWVNFQIRNMAGVFKESIRVITCAAERHEIGHTSREMLEGNAIYLLLRCCLMLRQSGYSERALATFQAMIELNFFRPDDLVHRANDETEFHWRERILNELESFWDLEVLRVGEAGAKGWRNCAGDIVPFASASATVLASARSTLVDPFERWATTESTITSHQLRPARTTDPGTDDDIDPFRVVLFDDVRDFLFVVHSPDSRTQLVYAFLTFIGLPFVPLDYPTTTPFQTDPFIHSELYERKEARERFWPSVQINRAPYDVIGGEAMNPVRTSALSETFDTPFSATPAVVDHLFSARQKWFVTLRKKDLKAVDVDLVRNVFTQLRSVVLDSFFDLNSFAFEACQSAKLAVKLAKQILRDQRQNLLLWDGYARIERQRGKIEDARAVYVTALSMYRTFPKVDQVEGPLLWRAWAEMEWEEGRGILAMRILVASSECSDNAQVDLGFLAKIDDDIRPSAVEISRTRQHYTTLLEASFQQKLSNSTRRNRNHLAYSFAIFEYVRQGLEQAVAVLEQHLFRLDCEDGTAGSAEHEEALMLYVKLLYRHVDAKVGYKPGQLRQLLETAIDIFPNNSLFLAVFYSNESRMKIQNRVRRVLETSVLKESVVTSDGFLFAIFAESHLDARSMNVWSVRNLFDRAIENPRTRSSASIWSLYIDFEVRNKEGSRAKALIYRSLQALPWCKELYLKPFSTSLRPIYRSHELREMHSLMLEKGIRVHAELDVGSWTSDSEMPMIEPEGELDSDNEMKPAELLFSERRKLMPY